jgi:cystathionine gamma-synthase
MTHAAMSEEAQLEAGIGTSLLRLSVGIEYAPDLVSDLSSALDHVQETMELPLNLVCYA